MTRIFAGLDQTVSRLPRGMFDQLQALMNDYSEAITLIEIVSDGPNHRQVDCVILSPGGADVIEIKDKRNPVKGSATAPWKTDDGGTLNEFGNIKGPDKENPYQQAAKTADDVKHWLSRRYRLSRQRFKAYPLVLIPSAHPDCDIKPHNWVHLALGTAQLLPELRALTGRQRIWEPHTYRGLPQELGLTPIDVVEVTGKTIDKVSGKALQRVRIEIKGLSQSLQVDSRGNFSFTVRPGVTLTLKLIPATLHQPLERVIQIHPDQRLIELSELYFEPVVNPQAVSEAEREVLRLQAALETVQANYTRDVESVHNEAERVRQEADEELRRLKWKQTQEAREVEKVQRQRLADQERLKELESRLTVADQQLATLSDRRPEDQAAMARLEEERQTHLAQIAAFRQAAVRHEQAAQGAEAKAKATQLELSRLQEEYPALLHRLQTIELLRDQQQAELDALREAHVRMQSELAEAVSNRTDQEAFTRQVRLAQKKAEEWQKQAEQQRQLQQQLQQELLEREQHERQFEQREQELQEQLEGALKRLEVLSASMPAHAGSVIARAVAWRERGSTGNSHSPLSRRALEKFQAGQTMAGASLPEQLDHEPNERWNLTPDELARQMRLILDRWGRELPILPTADQPVLRSKQARVRETLEELEDAITEGDLEFALDEARQVMASLVPEGSDTTPTETVEAPHPAVTLVAHHDLSIQARPWVLYEGTLRDLETGEDAELVIPGLQSISLAPELEGLVGLREGEVFVPIWALSPEEQLLAWLPDNWSAGLADAAVAGEEALASAASELSVAQIQLLCRTMPLEHLLDWTGLVWPATHLSHLHEVVMSRFAQDLELRGVSLRTVPVTEAQVQQALQLTGMETVSAPESSTAREGMSVPLTALNLDSRVTPGLPEGVRENGLYLHQALSLELIRGARAGHYDVVLSTPTASGKTMAFLPGVLESVLQEGGNALFLYPLRALSADQLLTLEGVRARMGEDAPLLGRHFGGEDVDLKAGIPRLLVATPDKLNYALDKPWFQTYLAGLRYVVLDEAHTYRGPFGTHMSGFLRRLLALCPVPPVLILSSATLQNTIQFARLLTGRERFRVAGSSTAPRFPRHLYVAPARAGQPHRSHLGTLRSFGDVVRQRSGKGLIFAGSRAASREIARELQQRQDRPLAPTAFAFYSGLQNYDAGLERLRDKGERPLIAASTSTLEAGIDIGDLDMVTVVGFPRSRNSFKQMIGRAGRAGTGHVAFLPGDSPADLYYSNPTALRQLIARESEPVYLNPHNPILMAEHVKRARYEAECSGLASGPVLLKSLFPEGLHLDDQNELMPLFDLPPHHAPAPQLRGDGSLPHVVVVVGGVNQPAADDLNLTVPEDCNWFLERLSPEAAYREWPQNGRATRENRYFQVISWRRGTLREEVGAFPQPVVIIAVQDITHETLRPEEVLTYLVKERQERALPEGKFAPRTRTAKVSLVALPIRLDEPTQYGQVEIEAGVGEVKLVCHGEELAEQIVEAKCELSKRKFTPPKLKPRSPVAVEVLEGETVTHHAWQVPSLSMWTYAQKWNESTDKSNPLWTAYTLPERMTKTLPDLLAAPPSGENYRRLPELDPAKPVPVLQVSVHEHPREVEGACSCGHHTKLEPAWVNYWSSVSERAPALPDDPLRWEAHDLEHYTFLTDMARLTIGHKDSDGGATRALMLAMVKAMPDLLEVDPQEFGVGVVASPDVGKLEFLIWDRTPGGSGITRALPEVLPALLADAFALLQRTRDCSCGGEGCFGCILPLERLISLIPVVTGDEQENNRIKGLIFSGFAEELQTRMALTLVEAQA